MAKMTLETFIIEFLMQQSPETKRAIKQLERGFQQLQHDIRGALRRAGIAIDDFSDDVADMSRESRTDLDRTGRATDELSRNVADMSRKVDRELDETEDSFHSMARGAQKSVGVLGAALGAIGGTAAMKGAADFRQEIARIDNQLENLNFRQIESAIVSISDRFAVNKDTVVLLASQIDDELAPTVEAFESRLTNAVKLQKSLGLEDITHAQRLINLGFIVAPGNEALFADQVAAFLQSVPIGRDEIDGLATGIERAFAAGIDPSSYLSLLSIGRFPSQEVAGAVLEDLGREIDEFMREGGVIDLEGLITGSMEIPDNFGEQTTIYINQVRDMEDAQTRFVEGQVSYNNSLGRQDQALRNISEASGGLTAALIWLDNRMTQVSSIAIDLGGIFAAILPAVGGAALSLRSLGFDLTGVGDAMRTVASGILHPVRSLQRFRAWLLTSTAAARGFANTVWTSSIGALRALGKRLALAGTAMLRFSGRSVAAGIAGVAAFAASIWTGAVPALTAFAAGVWTTTAALLANPITWMVLAIVGLVAAIALLVKNWDWVKTKVLGVWDTLKNFWDQWGGWISGVLAVIAPFIGIPLLIARNWDTVEEAVGSTVSFIRNAISGVIDWVRDNWPLLLAVLTGPFGLAIYGVWRFRDNVVAAFVWVRDRVVGIWQAVVDFILGAFERVKSIPSQVLDAIPGVGIAKNVLGALPGFASGGVVPGPVGAPQAAIVHGGEVVTPPGAITPIAALLDQFSQIIRAIVERLRADIRPLRDAVSRIPAPAPGRGFALPDGVIRMAQGFMAGPEAIMPAPSPVLAGAGGTTIVNNSGPPVLNIHENAIVIHATEGQSAVEIGRAVADELGKIARSMAADADSGIER